jgi:hypothetical protein
MSEDVAAIPLPEQCAGAYHRRRTLCPVILGGGINGDLGSGAV